MHGKEPYFAYAVLAAALYEHPPNKLHGMGLCYDGFDNPAS